MEKLINDGVLEAVTDSVFPTYILHNKNDKMENFQTEYEPSIFLCKETVVEEKMPIYFVPIKSKQIIYFISGIYSNEFKIYTNSLELSSLILKMDLWIQETTRKPVGKSHREVFRVDRGSFYITKYKKGLYIEVVVQLNGDKNGFVAEMTNGEFRKELELEEVSQYIKYCSEVLWERELISILQNQDISYYTDCFVQLITKGKFKTSEYVDTKKFEDVFKNIIEKRYDLNYLVEFSEELEINYLYLDGYHILQLGNNVFITEDVTNESSYVYFENGSLHDATVYIANKAYRQVFEKAELMMKVMNMNYEN